MQILMETILADLRNLLTPYKQQLALLKAEESLTKDVESEEFKKYIYQLGLNEKTLVEAFPKIINKVEELEKLTAWIEVDSYKDLPMDIEVLVKVENESSPTGFKFQIATNNINCPMVGNYFAWDAKKVLAYKPII